MTRKDGGGSDAQPPLHARPLRNDLCIQVRVDATQDGVVVCLLQGREEGGRDGGRGKGEGLALEGDLEALEDAAVVHGRAAEPGPLGPTFHMEGQWGRTNKGRFVDRAWMAEKDKTKGKEEGGTGARDPSAGELARTLDRTSIGGGAGDEDWTDEEEGVAGERPAPESGLLREIVKTMHNVNVQLADQQANKDSPLYSAQDL